MLLGHPFHRPNGILEDQACVHVGGEPKPGLDPEGHESVEDVGDRDGRRPWGRPGEMPEREAEARPESELGAGISRASGNRKGQGDRRHKKL